MRKILYSALLLTLLTISANPLMAALTITTPVNTGASVTVAGTGSTANGPVELFVNGISKGSVEANAAGAFSFSGVSLALGDKVQVAASQVWNFNTNANFEGWTIAPGSSATAVTSGALRLTASGGNLTFAIGTGSTATDSTRKVVDPNVTRVLEMRYRIVGSTGVAAPGLIITANQDFTAGMLSGQGWNPVADGQWHTSLVDVSRQNDGSTSPYFTGNVIQIAIGANGYAAGDVLEVDYIRLSEGFMWEFNNENDLMNWFATKPTTASLSVSGGRATVTALVANAEIGISQIFQWIDPVRFNKLSVKLASTASISPNLAFWNYLVLDGGILNGGYQANQVANGADQVVDIDLTAAPLYGAPWPTVAGKPATLNPAGSNTFGAMYAGAIGDHASIDYIRLMPATATGPSAEVTAAPPAGSGLVLNTPPATSGATVTGAGAVASGPVELFLNGVSQGSTVAAADGTFSFSGINLTNGGKLQAWASQVWNFNTAGNTEGWAAAGTSQTSATAGVLRLTPTGASGGNATWYIGNAVTPTSVTPRVVINPAVTRVIEMRYRIVGSTGVQAPGLIITADRPFEGGMLNGQGWNPVADGQWHTTMVDVSLLNNAAANPYFQSNVVQLAIGANGFANGDVIEIDYIRVAEGFMWEFNNDGDTMCWDPLQPTTTSLTVAGGKATITALKANAEIGITYDFNWIDPLRFNRIKVRLATFGSISPNLVFWNYFVLNGGITSGGLQAPQVADGNFENIGMSLANPGSLTTYGTPWPTTAGSVVTLNPPANTFGAQYAGAIGDRTEVDYLRLLPTGSNGPSLEVTVIPSVVNKAAHWDMFE